jgi:hypothetical protein
MYSVTNAFVKAVESAANSLELTILATEEEIKQNPPYGNAAVLIGMGLEEHRQKLTILKEFIDRYDKI